MGNILSPVSRAPGCTCPDERLRHIGCDCEASIGAFADLPEDDLDAAINAPKNEATLAALTTPAPFVETCSRCRGSGRFRSYSGRDLGDCHACKGTGKLSFKTSAEDRASRRQSKANSAVRAGDRNLEAFKAEHPVVFAWFDGSDYGFAVQMRESVRKFGSLTERQLAASYGAAAKLQAAKDASQARQTNAKAVDISKIVESFGRAGSSLKSPKLRVGALVISHAKAASKNAGALYVKSGDVYLGKIAEGRFIRSRDCRDDQEAALITAAEDPKAAAIAYGRLTGSCACCGRELTDPKSIELGIGPICADKWGF